jgi:hypothetical protein
MQQIAADYQTAEAADSAAASAAYAAGLASADSS